MKKHLLILATLAAALLGAVMQSCSDDSERTRSVEIVDKADISDIHSLAQEMINRGKDVSLSYDSINSLTVMTITPPQNSNAFVGEVGDNIVALTAVVLGLSMPAIVTVLVFMLIFRYLRRRKLDRYRVMEYAIDHGMQLPDSFYLAEEGRNTNTPRSAIVWIGWGLAIIVFFLCADMEPLASFGLIPLFIGVARGVTYIINRRDARQRERMDSTPLFEDTDENSDTRC